MEPKFKSKFSGFEVSAPQYLAELMCIRLAKKNNLPLPDKFWNTKEWRMPYKQQLMAAHALLKVYNARAVVAAVNRKEVSWMYSLRYDGLKQLIIEEQAKLERIEEKISKIEIPVENTTINKPQKPFSPKNNRINKLDE
jgi:hypothetical protein